MKNSSEYAQRLRKLYRELKRSHGKIEVAAHDDPVDALIYAIISESMSVSAAEAALRGIRDTFIDRNDLRVSRVEEIVELFGKDTPEGRKTAFGLTTALRAVFDSFHTVSLEALKKMGKRPAKQVLEGLQGVDRFAVNYCMLTSLQAHAIPLTGRMVVYLKDREIVDPQASDEEIEGFLTRQVAAKNAYDFYALLRCESESSKPVRRKTRKKTRPKRKNVAKAKK